eukprot:1021941-Pelagomonas_calceolata.AAC.9
MVRRDQMLKEVSGGRNMQVVSSLGNWAGKCFLAPKLGPIGRGNRAQRVGRKETGQEHQPGTGSSEWVVLQPGHVLMMNRKW